LSLVRILQVDDIDELIRIRREALESVPTAFASSVDQDRGLDPTTVREVLSSPQKMAIFGLLDDGERVVAMVGVFREEKEKLRHRANIYGMFVSDRFRGRGHGRDLLHAAVEHARSWDGVAQVHLSVSANAPAAKRLYESYGFQEWGREPRALCWKGEFFDESHLILSLAPDGESSE
jgi:ribosomal protein S18 acetylase RimI-like enzyme